jgi:hypothetical protein
MYGIYIHKGRCGIWRIHLHNKTLFGISIKILFNQAQMCWFLMWQPVDSSALQHLIRKINFDLLNGACLWRKVVQFPV